MQLDDLLLLASGHLQILKNPYLETTFQQGKYRLNARIWNGKEWDFEKFSWDAGLMMHLVGLYWTEFDAGHLYDCHVDITCRNTDEGPITIFSQDEKNRIILLHSKAGFWCQQIYQLAHELTHFFIGGKEENHNNWFYESLAELASNYFLEKMTAACAGSKFSLIKNYAMKIPGYIAGTNLYKAPPIPDPSTWLKEHEPHLLRNKTDRALNAQVANLLFPYFRKEKGIWDILLFAPHTNLPLTELLSLWKNKLSVNKPELVHHLEYLQKLFLLSSGSPNI